MRTGIAIIALVSLIPTTLAAGCKAVLSACSTTCSGCGAERYCSGYLKIMPKKTFTTSTQYTTTLTTYTETTVSVGSCPTHGPGGLKRRGEFEMLEPRVPEPTAAPGCPDRHDEAEVLEARAPEPTAALEPIDWAAELASDLERRALGPAPRCLRPYSSSGSSVLSSACHCFSYPITTSLETVTKRTLLSDAPTTTEYSATYTITTVTATATCGVSATNANGNVIKYKPIYQVCNAFRNYGNAPYGEEWYPKGTTLCDALNRCAAFMLTKPDAGSFDLTWTWRSQFDKPPAWWCRPFFAANDPNDPLGFFPGAGDNWYEGLGYEPVS